MTAGITRRDILAALGALGSLSLPTPSRAQAPTSRSDAEELFRYGVASGDPAPDGFVLWTRLAIDRGSASYGKPQSVAWSVAADPAMKIVVGRGTVSAAPEWDYAVHVEPDGLQPGRPYWYRFQAGGQTSTIGRTRTAPAAGAALRSLRFAVASCQHFEQGYFAAHRHLAAEALDFILFLGDYIYESHSKQAAVRRHPTADLQAAHAAFPWIVTWDDHEVVNDYAGTVSPDGWTVASFTKQRAAAYRAFYENMPLREAARPDGAGAQLYRQLSFGQLLRLLVLDTRQHRTRQPCSNRLWQVCSETDDPRASMMGDTQEAWLSAALRRSHARWNCLGQQVPMTRMLLPTKKGELIKTDAWDGYAAARARLLRFIADAKIGNPIVLTGDAHNTWIADLKENIGDAGAPTVATEFIGSSISSGGDGASMTGAAKLILGRNRHIRYFNGKRGYLRCEVTPETWRTDVQTVDFVRARGGAISTAATFVVRNGTVGAERI